MNISLAIKKSTKILKDKLIPNPELDSEILMAKTIQKDRKYDANLSKNNLMFNSGRKYGFVVKNLDQLIEEIKNNRIKKNIKQFRKKYPYFNEGNSIEVAKKIILEI